jgi:uncharacterized membrane protein
MPSGRIRWLVRTTFAAVAAAAVIALGMAPALAHGFSSVVYVDATQPEKGHLRTQLGLEYDLLVVSVADTQKDDPFFQEGNAAFDAGDPVRQLAALKTHAASVLKYVNERFTVASGEQSCAPQQVGDFTVGEREGVPYAFLVLDQTCADSKTGVEGKAESGYEVTSRLFPDSETFVRGTKTIVTYHVDGLSGSAALDAEHPSFALGQAWTERFWEFFRLGAEHLLGGLDHILFLLALIAGSRRLREIVLVATSFTVAHSVSFVLAALGLVSVSSSIVEPIIALSIAVVAGWYLWRIWQRGDHATDLAETGGHFSLDRAGWTRLGVVFCFGLVHGLGFAGALGIDQAWSWTLLWSLLVFNVGIEAVQIGLILLTFPLLTLLRHRAPRAGLWLTGALAAGVSAIGLIWFVQRVLGA